MRRRWTASMPASVVASPIVLIARAEEEEELEQEAPLKDRGLRIEETLGVKWEEEKNRRDFEKEEELLISEEQSLVVAQL